MSASMTMQELGDIIKHAYVNNSPLNSKIGPTVKYIDPCIDNRDGRCFAVTFRGFGDGVQFHTVNEQRSNSKSLFQRCMTYLDCGEVT